MAQYISAAEFLASPYGKDYQPGESIFDEIWQLDEYLQYISSVIDTYCGRTFEVNTYIDEFYDVGGSSLFLSVFPVVHIHSVESETFGAVTGAVSSSAYRVLSFGKLQFTSKLNRDLIYKVTYQAGYSNIPDEIKQATMMLAHTYLQAIDSGAVGIADGGALTGFKFGKFAESYVDPRQRDVSYNQGIPITVEAILRRFKYMK